MRSWKCRWWPPTVVMWCIASVNVSRGAISSVPRNTCTGGEEALSSCDGSGNAAGAGRRYAEAGLWHVRFDRTEMRGWLRWSEGGM